MKYVDRDELQVLGIVQEQHAERTSLYKQWRQFQWPIVQDSLNLLQVKVVPLVIAIDEKGRVVSHNASPKFLASWINGESGDASGNLLESDSDLKLAELQTKYLWHQEEQIDQVVRGFDALLHDSHSDDAVANFQAGVAWRTHFENTGDPVSFQKAIDCWSKALEIDPRQYIYRRRIEQYGARLGKPYPFYDWVDQARKEIAERGEEPVELSVEISGAEIAKPARNFASNELGELSWIDANKIESATDGWIQVESVKVPAQIRSGQALRVHVLIKPGESISWNNVVATEGYLSPLVVIDNSGSGVSISNTILPIAVPSEETSSEPRKVEFELLVNPVHEDEEVVKGVVLIPVCEKQSGVCTYVKQPFEVHVKPLRK